MSSVPGEIVRAGVPIVVERLSPHAGVSWEQRENTARQALASVEEDRRTARSFARKATVVGLGLALAMWWRKTSSNR